VERDHISQLDRCSMNGSDKPWCATTSDSCGIARSIFPILFSLLPPSTPLLELESFLLRGMRECVAWEGESVFWGERVLDCSFVGSFVEWVGGELSVACVWCG
jgi:hypothetical protein